MDKLTYNYVNGENPSERIRNKLSPLYTLVNIIDTTPEYNKIEDLIVACRENLIEINKHLDNVIPFYPKMKPK